jgi:hypothetical protein
MYTSFEAAASQTGVSGAREKLAWLDVHRAALDKMENKKSTEAAADPHVEAEQQGNLRF